MVPSALVLLGASLGIRTAAAQSFPAAEGEITVSEFMSFPFAVADYYGEWFEVYNNSHRNLDLNGLTIKDDSAESFRVTESLLVGIDAYVVFGVSDDSDLNGGIPAVDWVYDIGDFEIDSTGDTIELNYGGTVIDRVVWTAAGWDSLDRTVSAQANLNAYWNHWANDLPQNWCAGQTLYGDSGMKGSPGSENHWCDADNIDSDGDGCSETEGDCDDEDPYVHGACTDDDGADVDAAIDGDGEPYGAAGDDADCDGAIDDGASDDDEDGYTEEDGDCDDSDASVYPDRTEIADGKDNDCNGCIDDLDDDGDTWTECTTCQSDRRDNDEDGTVDETGELCEAFDCDDADTLVNPDQIESPYDGIDQDCDGFDACDEDDDGYLADPSHCVGGGNCCLDADGDSGDDCDDGQPTVHPNGTEGDPDAGGLPDGLDNDCNGIVDDPYGDCDEDGYRRDNGDCWDECEDPELRRRSALVNPGMTELCTDLLDNDCNGLVNDTCLNEATYALIRGGGLCGVAAGGGPSGMGGLVPAALAAAAAVVRRRRSCSC